jgi:hypothetical protein
MATSTAQKAAKKQNDLRNFGIAGDDIPQLYCLDKAGQRAGVRMPGWNVAVRHDLFRYETTRELP